MNHAKRKATHTLAEPVAKRPKYAPGWHPIPKDGIQPGDVAIILANGATDTYHCTLDNTEFTRNVRLWMVVVTKPYDPASNTLSGHCYKRTTDKGGRCFWKWDNQSLSKTELNLVKKEYVYHKMRSAVLHVFKRDTPVKLTRQLRRDIITYAPEPSFYE